jgi:hypothetical protein
MIKDNNCKPWDKPYYYVWEVAALWCGIPDRKIPIDDMGLPEDDPENPCLYARALWIMSAIDHGELSCGSDGGKSTDDFGNDISLTIGYPERTVRKKHLKEWFQYHQSDRPEFLFDEIERNTHSAINIESFQALQADLQAEKALHKKTQEQVKAMSDKLAAVEQERDSLKSTQKEITILLADERSTTSFLHLIGALLETIMENKLYKSEAALREYISEKYTGFKGCASRTTAGKFSEAKKLLSQ